MRKTILFMLVLAGFLPTSPSAQEDAGRIAWYDLSMPRLEKQADPPRDAPLARAGTEMKLASLPAHCRALDLDFCIDRRGRLVYPAPHDVLPEIAGFKRETVILKKIGLVMGYSF
jgi:hypothetical protein